MSFSEGKQDLEKSQYELHVDAAKDEDAEEWPDTRRSSVATVAGYVM